MLTLLPSLLTVSAAYLLIAVRWNSLREKKFSKVQLYGYLLLLITTVIANPIYFTVTLKLTLPASAIVSMIMGYRGAWIHHPQKKKRFGMTILGLFFWLATFCYLSFLHA